VVGLNHVRARPRPSGSSRAVELDLVVGQQPSGEVLVLLTRSRSFWARQLLLGSFPSDSVPGQMARRGPGVLGHRLPPNEPADLMAHRTIMNNPEQE
jgi:hypothetical protein